MTFAKGWAAFAASFRRRNTIRRWYVQRRLDYAMWRRTGLRSARRTTAWKVDGDVNGNWRELWREHNPRTLQAIVTYRLPDRSLIVVGATFDIAPTHSQAVVPVGRWHVVQTYLWSVQLHNGERSAWPTTIKSGFLRDRKQLPYKEFYKRRSFAETLAELVGHTQK